jgi:hypothetical protein
MQKHLIGFLFLCANLSAQASVAHAASLAEGDQKLGNTPIHALNPVVQWNRILLGIVRTPGAQPVTVHSTRSFAIMHAVIYDAVNAIDRRHKPYLVTMRGVSPNASQEAAAAAAAHEVLVELYPAFKTTLDGELRTGRTKPTVLLQGWPSRIAFWLCEAMTAPMLSRFLTFSGPRLVITNRRLRTFLPSRSSRIGLMSHRLP